jgi:quercetin dioxygenase-like cupin family protein
MSQNVKFVPVEFGGGPMSVDVARSAGAIEAARVETLATLLGVQPHGIASRVIGRSAGGNVTLFTIDAGEGLSEHTAPFDALALVVDGLATITVGGTPLEVGPGQVVRMPADVPHAVMAEAPTRMLLIMLKQG